MKEIRLTNSKKKFLVDDEDFERVNSFKWYLNSKGQVVCTRQIKPRNVGRFIMNYSGSNLIDHKDGDNLNNQKTNLREATSRQNKQNSNTHKNSSSKYKGVWWDKHANKWRASIAIRGMKRHLGTFNTEEEAAMAYNYQAEIHFGEFVKLNNVNNV